MASERLEKMAIAPPQLVAGSAFGFAYPEIRRTSKHDVRQVI